MAHLQDPYRQSTFWNLLNQNIRLDYSDSKEILQEEYAFGSISATAFAMIALFVIIPLAIANLTWSLLVHPAPRQEQLRTQPHHNSGFVVTTRTEQQTLFQEIESRLDALR